MNVASAIAASERIEIGRSREPFTAAQRSFCMAVESRDAQLSLLMYLAAVAAVVALLAFTLYWLHTPRVVPNPGLAAYKPPKDVTVVLALPSDSARTMERAALLAAEEANGSTSADPQSKRAFAAATKPEAAEPAVRKPEREVRKPTQRSDHVAQSRTRRPAYATSQREPLPQREPLGRMPPRGFAQGPWGGPGPGGWGGQGPWGYAQQGPGFGRWF